MKRKREKSKFLFDIIGYNRKRDEGLSNSNALTSRMNERDARRIVENGKKLIYFGEKSVATQSGITAPFPSAE